MWVVLNIRKRRAHKHHAIKRNKSLMASSSIELVIDWAGTAKSKKDMRASLEWRIIRWGRNRNLVVFDQSLEKSSISGSQQFAIAL